MMQWIEDFSSTNTLKHVFLLQNNQNREENKLVNMVNNDLKGLAQAKIIKKSVILFRLFNMTI